MVSPSDVTRRVSLGLALGAAATTGARAGFDPPAGNPKERVVGIGGFFFRANDPRALARWYADNLGVAMTPESYDTLPWRTEAGTTIFAPFPGDSPDFGDPSRHWMINFRVRDLDRMTAQLRANGVAVSPDPHVYPNGRFAKLVDPEGNPIQLWQPGGKDPG